MQTNLALPTLENIPSQSHILPLLAISGSNRADVAELQIEAHNDIQAIHCWLNEYQHKPTTYRVYQKEAERLILWCLYQYKKPLSSLNRNDFENYIEFLKDPSPREVWVGSHGGRGHLRGSVNWKPFKSPLNSTSLNTAITIINSMMTYLVDAGYLQKNPLKLLRNKRQQPSIEERQIELQARILELDEWSAMLQTLDEMSEHTPHDKDEKERLRFIVSILYFLGLRIGELTTHTWSSFRQIEGNWWFIVRGKGDKLGKVPVNDEFWKLCQQFRMHLRLAPIPQSNETIPLIPSWRSRESLTARQINKVLKFLAIKTAEKFPDRPDMQAKLKRFSAHWLRHLSATMQSRAGIEFGHIRANHRHENDETTRLYVHSFDKERHDAMSKLQIRED